MKITNLYDPSIVRELTRYIRPSELDEFAETEPLGDVSDKNNFDEFFREYELYDPALDDATQYHQYSVDDLPLSLPNRMINRDICHYNSQQLCPIESELPEYITLFKTGRKIYVETLPGYIRDEIYARSRYDAINPEITLNILSEARTDRGTVESLANEAFHLINQKYPYALVVKYMNMAKLKGPTIPDFRYSRGLLTFISQYPDARDCVVSHDSKNNEKFDADSAQAYKYFYNKMNCSTEEISKILADCRVYNRTKGYVFNSHLLALAKVLYQKERAWTDVNHELMLELKRYADGSTKGTHVLYKVRNLLDNNNTYAILKRVKFARDKF